MYPVKTVIVNTSFQKWTPEWKFLKTPAFRLRADGLRACLHGGGGPQVGEVTRLSIQSLILIWSRLHDRWGDPTRVTSPAWGLPTPCKQALKTKVFEYDDVMHHIWQALGMLCGRCYRTSILLAFSCERAKNISEYPPRGSEFFSQTEKKNLRFQKNPDTCGRGLNVRPESSIYHLCMPHPFNQLPFPQSQRPVSWFPPALVAMYWSPCWVSPAAGCICWTAYHSGTAWI